MKNVRLLMASLLLILAACEKEAEPVSIDFASRTYQMTVGQTMDLTGELTITNTDRNPSFSSSDEDVVSVNRKGKVTAVAQGTAVITAEVADKTASCTIQVSEVKAGKIELTCPQSLPADETWAEIVAEVEPAGFDPKNLVWTFTSSSEELVYETEKVKAASYKVRFMTFVEGASLNVNVADRNSNVEGNAVIEVTEKVVPASKIRLEMPMELTEGEVWASVTAEVTPEEYDVEHLVWEFEPSSESMGFRSEKVSPSEYKVCFETYVEGGYVIVKVSDELSETFNQGRIKVIEKPIEGVVSLSVAPESLTLNVGDDPVSLQVTYEPSDYDKSLLEWTSSDEEVADVADGVVTVCGEGQTLIKVRDSISGKEASCAVTVMAPVQDTTVIRISVSPVTLNLRVGEDAAQLKVTGYNEAGDVVENYSEVEWSAEPMIGEDNKEITVVEVSPQGVVVPKNPGSTQITVADKNNPNVKAYCNVTVVAAEVKVESVRLEPSSKTIQKGDSFALTAFITPDNAENKTLTYVSSNENVAVVTASGVVTGVDTGESIITATSSNGIKGQCKVIVTDQPWVVLDEDEITLLVGAEKTLTAVVYPESVADRTVTWSSTDPQIASVQNGKVTALKAGECAVKATASNGSTAECKVIVENDAVEFEIALAPDDPNLFTKGLMQDKSVRIYPQYTRVDNGKSYAPASVSWASSDESVATVDSDGNVTAVIGHIDNIGIDNGKRVTITHVADGISKTMEIVVVKAMPEEVVITSVPEVDGVPYKMMHGDSFRFTAKVLPEKASQHVDFTSSTQIAFLEDGVFHAASPGQVDFVAYAGDDRSVKTSFKVEVLPIMIESAVISETSLELNVGDEKYLTVDIQPSNASYKTVEWTSSAVEIVEVGADGKVKALAAGSATVTGTLHGGLAVTCGITVKESGNNVNVGDFFYSNGKTSSSAEETGWGEIIGVVFSVKNPTLQDSGLDAGCTHGLVLSLEETADVKWQESSSNVGSWLAANTDYSAITDIGLECGFSNTQALNVYNASNESSKVLVTGHAPSVTLPSGTSGWYVPSYAELQLVLNEYDAVSAGISAAGGTALSDYRGWIDGVFDGYRYWTSTESPSSSSWACAVQFHGDASVRQGYTNALKSKGYYRVRYIFAF